MQETNCLTLIYLQVSANRTTERSSHSNFPMTTSSTSKGNLHISTIGVTVWNVGKAVDLSASLERIIGIFDHVARDSTVFNLTIKVDS